MTMPSSGPLNLGGTSTPVSVAQELGLGLTSTISMNDAAVRTLAGAGGSGTSWSMNSLYGKSNRVTSNITISANTQNYVLNTSKVTGYSAGKTDVILTINSGVYVGSSSTGGIALDVDTSWNSGDTVTIVNNGYIVGCAGNAGSGGYNWSVNDINGTLYAGPSSGAAGGPALRVQRATTINNTSGVIGGGGGGGGGFGGGWNAKYQQWYYACGGGGGGGGQGSNGGSGGGGGGAAYALTGNPGSSGGAGTATSAGGGGSGGPIAGGVYGGAGGSGGSFGATGGTGVTGVGGAFTGGAGGGGGGNCTTSGSNANITWSATGTRYGTIG